ncbi:unnamed protein product [Brassica oleracea var. botrytis]|uniref:(rape) hypothetical protein n=1 Tax=Brassica napus TaxID=3708 RepID=A0A816IGZ6_BRANA|nr:unnamed protein product [Brassica napus]
MNDERVDPIIDMYRKKMMVQRKKRLEKEVTMEWKKK